MALLSKILTPSSTIEGTFAFGLIARYSGLNCSPRRGIDRNDLVGEPHLFERQRDFGRVGRTIEIELDHACAPWGLLGVTPPTRTNSKAVAYERRACSRPAIGTNARTLKEAGEAPARATANASLRRWPSRSTPASRRLSPLSGQTAASFLPL